MPVVGLDMVLYRTARRRERSWFGQDIHKIVDTFTRVVELTKYTRMVSLAEIADAKNDYNL